jgi:hypothetical protein
LELDFCCPRGIPLSVFRGAPSVPGKPVWTDDDRLWALAWEYDAQSKLACGCYPDETTGIDNDDAFRAIPLTCHRHKAITDAQAQRQKNANKADSPYVPLWRTVKDEPV